MTVWDNLLEWFRSVLDTTSPGDSPPQDPPQSMQPRVLLITFNPTIESEGGRTLSQVLGWRNVDQLCQGFIADLKECSDGLLEYQITQRIDADAWPVKIDGFRYDGAGFLQSWRSRSGFHDPDQVDYEAIIADYDLIQRVESDQIDEVWLFGFPYAGFYESIMVGPGAFWCNAPPIPRDDVSRRFVIMGFNYERGIGPMLESFGHRVESHLQHTWRHQHGTDNLWQRFILYDQKAPGQANCGWMHYAPNSVIDYDWGNETMVLSNCDDWLNFPNFQGTVRKVNCREWGNGDMRAHHKWWFQRLPRASGHIHGIANNWWWYGVDPNAVE
ncbi:MAG: hypothetical protein PVJ26_13095 [Anaerolineae bacterium]